MQKREKELKHEVRRLLKDAERCDAQEDRLYGKGKRGDELPEELRFRETRLKKIREAMEALQEEARQEAQEKQREQDKSKNKTRRGPPGKASSGNPDAKKQYNFTDPDSRIMKDSTTKAFEQAYNCQAAVDAESQVIVASDVTRAPNDKEQVEPMIEKIAANIPGKKPKRLSADAGYFSEDNCYLLAEAQIDAYVAAEKFKHGEPIPPAPRGRLPNGLTTKQRMARKLRTIKGRMTYSKRKEIVEPVFGQIKEIRGFRRFSLRGLSNVTAEWDLICLTHNLLKLFRNTWALQGWLGFQVVSIPPGSNE